MKVHFYATLRQIVGKKTIEIPVEKQGTLQQLVDEVITRYPALSHEMVDEQGDLYGYVHVFVNGRDSRFLEDGLRTVVDPEDTVSMFPAVGGGARMRD
ncbi:MAG: MoaD/ThiS family protein [Anaerolineales bacterium]|jgi:molybdopterin synthase sulfur carrier subunit|nr:MoaD/ThiS family protein [Anaerolineales bacterium]